MSPSSALDGQSQAQPNDISKDGSDLREERSQDGGDQQLRDLFLADYGQEGEETEEEEKEDYLNQLQEIADLAKKEASDAFLKLCKMKEALLAFKQTSVDPAGMEPGASFLRALQRSNSILHQEQAIRDAREDLRHKDEAEDDARVALDDADVDSFLTEIEYSGDSFPNNTDDFTPSRTKVFTRIYPKTMQVDAIDPAELRDPEAMDSVPMSARRWRFTHKLSQADVATAHAKFLNVLNTEKYDLSKCIVTFPAQTGHDRYVQIHFQLSTDYVRSKNLKLVWRKRQLELVSSAAPMSRRKTVIKINDVLCTGSKVRVLTEIFEALGGLMQIEVMWRLDHEVRLEQGIKNVRGASVIAVATYQDRTEETFWKNNLQITVPPNVSRDQNGTGMYWKPHQIPGWIATSHGTFQLHFLGRQPSCVFCRQTKLMPYYHTTEECTLRKCPNCDGNGHSEIECPFRSKKRSRTGELLSAFRRL